MRKVLVLVAIGIVIAGFYVSGDSEIDPVKGFAEAGFYELETDEGYVLSIESGRVAVPENRARPDSRQISIAYYRVKGASDGPPIVMLDGGPGGSFTEKLAEGGARQESARYRVDLYRQFGDVIMPDLRGINLSQPNIRCDGSSGPWIRITSDEAFAEAIAGGGKACRDKLVAEGFDLAGYNIIEAAADVVAVMDSLGYDTFRVAGGSFGGQLAFTLLKYHGERIDRAIIDGVEPYDHTYDDPRGLHEAAQRISAMAADAWQARGNEGDPLSALIDLAQRAEQDPDTADGLSPLNVYALGLQGLGSRKSMKSWVATVDDLLKNGPSGVQVFLLRNVGSLFLGPRGWDPAASGLIDCASGVSDARRADMESYDHVLFNEAAYFFDDARCRGWNVPELPDEFRQFDENTTPVLFVQGSIDFSTPPSNVNEALQHFPNSHLIVVENGSHGAYYEALTLSEQMKPAVEAWLSGEIPATERILLPPVEFE
ncbi:MAG: alpha/beta hydrolase [Pseudomonadota bacterium]